MIVSKNKPAEIPSEPTKIPILTVEEELVAINPLAEAYKAVRSILSELRSDPDDPNSPPLFRTIKMDNGQLARIKNNTHNLEYGIAFPAVLIHYIDVNYNVGQSRIGEGKGTMRIHYILNTLNNSDDEIELEGLEVYRRIVEAIESRKADFQSLVTRFQLQYWDQPLSFDDGLQPYWIDYQIWFNDYSGYRYKNYVETTMVIPPFTNHSDQLPENNPDNHPNHDTPEYEEVSIYEVTDTVVDLPTQVDMLIYNGEPRTPVWKGEMDKVTLVSVAPQTNVGLYTALFQPNDGYSWDDGTRSVKIANWSIIKATQFFNAVCAQPWCGVGDDEVEISIVDIRGDGELVAVSADESVATVRVENNSVFVKGISRGEVRIKVSLNENSNYKRIEKQVNVFVTDIVYTGVSSDEINGLDKSNRSPIPSNGIVSVSSDTDDQIRCHWVAVPASSSKKLSKVTDVNNEDITFNIDKKTIDGYDVYYLYSDFFLSNTTNFIFSE